MSNSRLTRFINELRNEEALCAPGETAYLTLGQIQEAADYLEELKELQNEPFKKINSDELIDELKKRGHTVISQRYGYTQVLVGCTSMQQVTLLTDFVRENILTDYNSQEAHLKEI